MSNNNTVHVTDTLAVFPGEDGLAIGRDDGGLVHVQLREVRHLVDTLATLAAEQATGQELDGLGQAAISGWLGDALMEGGSRQDELQAEVLRLRGEMEQVRAMLAGAGLRAGDDLAGTLALLLRWYRRSEADRIVWFSNYRYCKQERDGARHMAQRWKKCARRLWARCRRRAHEVETAYGWVQALQVELAEWQQAAEEAQDVQVGLRVPLAGELSSQTRPEDFVLFAERAACIREGK